MSMYLNNYTSIKLIISGEGTEGSVTRNVTRGYYSIICMCNKYQLYALPCRPGIE